MESKEYIEAIWKGNNHQEYQDRYKSLPFSPYDSLSEIQKMYEEDCSTQEATFISILKNIKIESAVVSGQKEVKKESERELLDNMLITTKALIDEIEKTINKIQRFPKEDSLIKKTLYAITVIFLIGVIFPLSFTPCFDGVDYRNLEMASFFFRYINSLVSIKGLLLLVVTISFMYIIILFLNKMSNFRISQKRIDAMKQETNLEKYSEYFVNYENNKVNTTWAD